MVAEELISEQKKYCIIGREYGIEGNMEHLGRNVFFVSIFSPGKFMYLERKVMSRGIDSEAAGELGGLESVI